MADQHLHALFVHSLLEAIRMIHQILTSFICYYCCIMSWRIAELHSYIWQSLWLYLTDHVTSL